MYVIDPWGSPFRELWDGELAPIAKPPPPAPSCSKFCADDEEQGLPYEIRGGREALCPMTGEGRLHSASLALPTTETLDATRLRDNQCQRHWMRASV
jgi:hypothetical protein